MENVREKQRKLSVFINYNGTIVKREELIFNSTNRSFRYGDGLFESIRMIEGKIMFPQYHAERIKKGAELLAFENSNTLTQEFLESIIYDLCRRNKFFLDARVRLVLFRSSGGFYTPISNQFEYLLEIEKIEDRGYSFASKGISIAVFDEHKKNIDAFSAFKTNNSLLYVLASNFKKLENVDAAIVLNQHGRIAEADNSNIFLVKNKELFTPSVDEGCIAGVFRKVVIETAKASGIKVNEGPIELTYLNTADEVFITNSSQGIRWVGSFGMKRYFNSITRELYLSIKKSTSMNS